MKLKACNRNKQPLDKTQSSKLCQLSVKRTRFQNLKEKRKWFFDHSGTLKAKGELEIHCMFPWWNGQNNNNSTFIHSYSFNLVLDIDECSSNSHSCDANAVCNNTRGSYTCACKLGYSGDGKNCTGKVLSLNKKYKITTTHENEFTCTWNTFCRTYMHNMSYACLY